MTEPGRTTLTVYLLPKRGGRHVLVSPDLEQELAKRAETGPEETPSPEVDTNGGNEPEPNPTRGRRLLRRAARWLEARGDATERVLKELRLPEAVEVVHPAGLPAHKARRIFRREIEQAVRRHRRWLVVDGVLLPVSVLLSIVPGPNVLLPYLAWRTLAHWRGQRGGSRALRAPDATFVADPTLDPLLDLARRRFVLHRKRRLRAIGERAGIPSLERHL